MKTDAILSDDRQFRYVLSRVWDEEKPTVMFIGLNPSTADECEDDPTIQKCIKFAQSWDYGGLYMLNLFAYRTTNPRVLWEVKEPIGNGNDDYIKRYSDGCDKVICAWGNNGDFMQRGKSILQYVPNAHYLKLNKSGQPSHPLYLKSTLTPQKFTQKDLNAIL